MDKAKLILGGGAITGVLALAILALTDPTRADQTHLEALAKMSQGGARLSSLTPPANYAAGTETLAQSPIFVMTTGTGAYAEKTFQLFGVSISANRKAALVSINGATPVWVRAGEVSDDVQLIDVTASSARFDTAVGERSVNLSDPPPTAAATASHAGAITGG
jgi:predicted aconitase